MKSIDSTGRSYLLYDPIRANHKLIMRRKRIQEKNDFIDKTKELRIKNTWDMVKQVRSYEGHERVWVNPDNCSIVYKPKIND